MFNSWGGAVWRWRRAVLAGGLVFLVLAGLVGPGVFDRMVGGGFEDPASESTRAELVLEDALGREGADVVVLYSDEERTVDDPSFRREVEQVLDGLPAAQVAGAVTFWSTGAPELVSQDRRSTLAVLQLVGDDEEQREQSLAALEGRLSAPGLDTRVGGTVPGEVATNEQVEQDIARAEMLSLPVLAVLLVLVFGSLVAASLPLFIGVLSVLGALLVLDGLSYATDISIFALNIVILLGLGLAVDYALFMVSRFREELAAGLDVPSAVRRTVETAGRTVAFSGLIVTAALAGLLVFPQPFLRSMGLGGMAAVVVAASASLTVLPALLGVLGHRVDKGRLPFLRRRAVGGGGGWARTARAVMARPALVLGGTVALLLVLGAPFLRVEFGTVDARALPAANEVRQVSERLLADFPGSGTEPVDVALVGVDEDAAQAYAQEVATLPGVTSAELRGTAGDVAGLTVVTPYDPLSDQARDVVGAVRGVPAPDGAEVLVGGTTAAFVDLQDGLADRLPIAGALVVGVMLVLLFLAFGSVLLPIKAVLMNVLSLSAMFGVLVWVFQEGNLSGPLGVESVGPIESTQPILILAIAFGLSMDYEVFLLSRIREQWDATHDNRLAVETGLARTGGIITSAALLLIVVVGAFATSGVVFIQMLGVGLVVAIAVDATLVRGLLVPAVMRLMGDANWWAPAPLRRVWERFGVREGGDAVPVLVPVLPAQAGAARSPVSR